MGMFLLDILQESLLELDKELNRVSHLQADQRPNELLKIFNVYEEQDKFMSTNSPFPDNILGRYSEVMGDLMIPLF